MGPVLFFGTSDELPSERIRREARAKLFCARCEVLGDCRLDGQDEEGIWGGQTESERRRAQRTVFVTPLRVTEPKPVDLPTDGWVALESRNGVSLYRCDDPQSWHGSVFVVVRSGTIMARTYDLADAYIKFNDLLP